jgi:hypothetical protein
MKFARGRVHLILLQSGNQLQYLYTQRGRFDEQGNRGTPELCFSRLQMQIKVVLFLSSALHIHELAVSFLTVFNYNRGFD